MISVKKVCCPVCFEDYEETEHAPKVLTCGHTICSQCLVGIIDTNKDKAKCPECRVRVNPNRFMSYPTNYTVLQIMNTFSESNSTKKEINLIVARYNNMKDRINYKITEMKEVQQSNQINLMLMKSVTDGLKDEQQQIETKIQELSKWLDDVEIKEQKLVDSEDIKDAKISLDLAEDSLFEQDLISSQVSIFSFLYHPV